LVAVVDGRQLEGAEASKVLATGASIVPIKASYVLFRLVAQKGHAPAGLRAASWVVAASRGAFRAKVA